MSGGLILIASASGILACAYVAVVFLTARALVARAERGLE